MSATAYDGWASDGGTGAGMTGDKTEREKAGLKVVVVREQGAEQRSGDSPCASRGLEEQKESGVPEVIGDRGSTLGQRRNA